MLSHFFGQDLTGIAVPQKTFEMPRKVDTKHMMDLASVMYWVLMEHLHLYENNRGDGALSSVTFKSCAEGVKPNEIGEFTIGMHNGRMTLANGHSRLAGFFKRLINGELSAKELSTVLYVTVTSNFLGSYRINNSAPAHRTKDKIKNKDLAYGTILDKIFQETGPDCQKLIGENKWTVLSSILYNLAFSSPTWFWPDVYQKRQIAMKMANDEAGALSISKADQARLINAVKTWHQIMEGLNNKANEGGLNVKKVTGNAGLFGFLVCNLLRSDSQLSTPPVLIKKMLRKLPDVQQACPELCRGDRGTVVRYTTELERLLKKS